MEQRLWIYAGGSPVSWFNPDAPGVQRLGLACDPGSEGNSGESLYKLPGGQFVLVEWRFTRSDFQEAGRQLTLLEACAWLSVHRYPVPPELQAVLDSVELSKPPAVVHHPVSAPPHPDLIRSELPELPHLSQHVYSIHYSQELQVNCPSQTPPVSAIIVQHLLTSCQETFAAFRLAEERGITPIEYLSHSGELERELLIRFYDFVATRQNAVWVHWGMRQARFGFDVLSQRARLYGLTPFDIPMNQRFDIASYLKRRFGDGYAPHPRFLNVLRWNGLVRDELLDEEAAARAWEKREYARLIVSLSCKVDAIADLFDRLHLGTLTVKEVATKEETGEETTPEQAMKRSSGTSGAPTSRPNPRPSVELRDAKDGPIVLGKVKKKLTQPQYNVIQTLLKSGDVGLTKDELAAKSGHEDARGILKRLAEKDEDWKKVIHFAGMTGGGYRIQ